jgi:1-acyl-sn-glycerol-3-phosphate acyltransferase
MTITPDHKTMKELIHFTGGSYHTPQGRGKTLPKFSPSLTFYARLVAIVTRSSRRARRGRYDTWDWATSSFEVFTALERVGVQFHITGADNIAGTDGPCLFIGNHMSSLETFVLPCIIVPFRDVTFVVKESLIDYPVFKHVMRSRDPVTVGRANPREDLRAVLGGGTEILKSGRSIVIFPQTTRTHVFDPGEFNTIGIKLAKKAGVPVIPVALRTDAWGTGRRLKDFGPIDPSKAVHFAFGSPMHVTDRGNSEHRSIIAFITGKLREWGADVKAYMETGGSSD